MLSTTEILLQVVASTANRRFAKSLQVPVYIHNSFPHQRAAQRSKSVGAPRPAPSTMLQASSSAPSLAASPYASTMSAESAMLLREIDSLEWMIDGVCFEYGPRLPGLRRRRGLREGRGRAVARRPPV